MKSEGRRKIDTMVDGFWWSFITMSGVSMDFCYGRGIIFAFKIKVGYGDMVPYSGLGKCFAVWCAIFGVIIFGLPIPVIVRAFSKYYSVVNNKHSRILVKYNLSQIRGQDESSGERKKSVISNMGINVE